MADETLLVALFGGLHLIGFGFGALLLLPCLRDEQLDRGAGRGEDEDGGGGSDRIGPAVPHRPRDGGPRLPVPLPDAAPARVRLRDGRRLADLRRPPTRERRPQHVPDTPRTPVRGER
jgi:hypothetical protein